MLLGTCLTLTLLCVNPTRAAPPFEAFAGQWITYQWESTENSSGWFPGYIDYLHLSAACRYSILAVTDAYQASVRMEGSVEWPQGSINRTLAVLTMLADGSMLWESLGGATTFDYSHYAIVALDDGSVLSTSGEIALRASYTYPGSPHGVSCLFLQDQYPGLSVYFFDEVDAAVGSNVSAWAGGSARVLGHGQLETRTGARPAIVVFYNTSRSLPPMWADAEQLTLQYDRETGFLLQIRHRIQSWVNVTRTSRWDTNGSILATNMYGPRPVFLLAQAFLAAACLGAMVTMVLVSRWLLRELRRNKAALAAGAVAPN